MPACPLLEVPSGLKDRGPGQQLQVSPDLLFNRVPHGGDHHETGNSHRDDRDQPMVASLVTDNLSKRDTQEICKDHCALIFKEV